MTDPFEPEYVRLTHLSQILDLPVPYLERLADVGLIPFLDIGGRTNNKHGTRRFNVNDIRAKLKQHAEEVADKRYKDVFGEQGLKGE
jgi:hypothetical protein